MTSRPFTSSRAAMALVISLLGACSDDPRTALRTKTLFAGSITPTQLEVKFERGAEERSRRVPETASSEQLESGLAVLLPVPDTWASQQVRVTVTGLTGETEIGQGTAVATVALHETVDVEVTLLPLCEDSCSAGDSQCVQDELRHCRRDARGCAGWSPPEPCPAETPFCSLGRCEAGCQDECVDGQGQCEGQSRRSCGQHDSDACLDWGPLIGCAADELCRDGACVLDCDGEPCECEPGQTQICAEVGECSGGVRQCVNGSFGSCQWEHGPVAEMCNGADDDCNGTPDDGLIAPACDQQDGVCSGAVKQCGGAEGWLSCDTAVYSARATSQGLSYEAQETLCDGQDNDCNGQTDEHASCACQPACTNKPCGADDGCGHPCQSGTCAEHASCQAGSCVCDLLSCGAACCAAGAVCGVQGQCEAPVGWSRGFGGGEWDEGRSVATDSSGHVYLTGYFRQTVDFGDGPLTSGAQEDIFLSSYDSSGAVRWSHRFGDDEGQTGKAVATDSSGNVVLAGFFQGTVDFGDGLLSAAGGPDIFLASFDSNGSLRWSKRFGGSNSEGANAVTTDSSGNIYLIGSFRGTVDFGDGLHTSAGESDIFLASFESSGSLRWSRRLGGSGADEGNAVATGGDGTVYITGSFSDIVDFGDGPLTSAGGQDIFLASFESSGSLRWSNRYGSALRHDAGLAVAVDSADSVYLTGFFWETVDFGDGPLTSAGDQDIFLARVDPSGTVQWSRRFGGSSGESGKALSVDSDGNVYLSGSFMGTMDLGDGPLTAAGASDIYLASVDPSGSLRWSKRFGSNSDEHVESLAIDQVGGLYLTGRYQDTVDLGHGPLTSAGYVDIFLLKYIP